MKIKLNCISVSLFLFIMGCSNVHKNSLCNKSITQKFILDNGLIVVAKKYKGHSLVTMEFLVKTGSAGENEFSGTGISHFLEHLIFKGTKKFPPGEIARYIKLLGGEIDGYTTYDYTSFSITVPKENAEKSLEVLIDALFNPILREEDFTKEREVILNEMLMEKDVPQRRIFRLFWQKFYRIHPYRHPIIGYTELFSKLSLEEIKKFHANTYIPNNMILAVVGDFEDELFAKLRMLMSGIERKKEIEIRNVVEPALTIKISYEEDYPTELMHLIIGFSGIEISHEDLFALDILATILGEGKSSRLYNKLKVKKNLVYSISCFNHTPKEKGIFGIYLTGEYKDKKEIIENIFEELRRIKKHTIPSKEVEKAKNILIHNFYLSHEKIETQAHQLATGEFLVGDPDFYYSYIERIKKITKNDLKRVARKYFKDDNFVEVILKPISIKERTEEIEGEDKQEEISKVIFKNGLTVLIKEDSSLPLSSLNIVFLGGLRLEEGELNGISNLLANLLTKGFKNKTEGEINELIEKKGGCLNSFSGNNSLGISLSIINRNKNTLWGIYFLSKLIKSISLTNRMLEKEKVQTLAKIKQNQDDPISYAFKIMRKKLFPHHPYGRDPLGEKETIERINLKDIYSFYNKVINPKNCVISVFGDFKKEAIIKAIEKTFSDWRGGENFLYFKIDKETPIEQPIFYQERIKKKQAVIAIGFRTVSIYEPEFFTFKVLEEILGGQGNRLFENIREKLGMVYFVDSYNFNGLDTGYFVFIASTAPNNLERVKELIFEEIKNLKLLEFSNEEIERAKAYIIGKQKRELQTKESFALTSSLNEIYGLGFDFHKKFEEKINSVSKIDLKKAIEKYFKENNFVVVELFPEE